MLRLADGAREAEGRVEYPVVARRVARTEPELRLVFTGAGGASRLLRADPGAGVEELRLHREAATGQEQVLQCRRVWLPGPGLLWAARGAEHACLTVAPRVELPAGGPAGVRVLVTAFQPFPTPALHDNVSRLALAALDPGALGPGVLLHRALLPVEFDAAARRLQRLVRRLRPQVVLALGQGQDQLALELVARNRTGRLLAGGEALRDNAGQTRAGLPLVPGGPAELATRLPVAALHDGLRRIGERPVASLDAGTFICNEVFHGLLREVERAPSGGVLAGFVHLPRTRASDARTRARWGQVATVMVRELCASVR